MRVVRASFIPAKPWKNGGGITHEIAISPPESTMDSFDWRLSMASVDKDCEFSVFPGIDRHLYVLEGQGLVLISSSSRRQVLRGERVDFAGEEQIHGMLLGGPITDLNIMTRRSKVSAGTRELVVRDRLLLKPERMALAIFIRTGSLMVTDMSQRLHASKLDTIVIESGTIGPIEIQGKAEIILVMFRPRRSVITPESLT